MWPNDWTLKVTQCRKGLLVWLLHPPSRAAMVGQVNAGLFMFYGSLRCRLIIRYLIYKDAGFLYLLGTELTLQRVI